MSPVFIQSRPSLHSLVVFAQQQSDLVELRPLRRLLRPAALHKLTQLRTVTLWVVGRSETRPLAQDHPVYDLCRQAILIDRYFQT